MGSSNMLTKEKERSADSAQFADDCRMQDDHTGQTSRRCDQFCQIATKSLSDLLDLDSSWRRALDCDPNEVCLAVFDGSRGSTTPPDDRERDDNAVSTDLALLQEQVSRNGKERFLFWIDCDRQRDLGARRRLWRHHSPRPLQTKLQTNLQ